MIDMEKVYEGRKKKASKILKKALEGVGWLVLWYSILMVGQMILLIPIIVLILAGLQFPDLMFKMMLAIKFYLAYMMIAAVGIPAYYYSGRLRKWRNKNAKKK